MRPPQFRSVDEVDVSLDGSPSGPGTVTAFEESAEDSAPINVYEVPVTFG